MAWTNSKMFRQTVADIWQNTIAIDVDIDTVKAALYNNTGTPSQDDTTAHIAYNGAGGPWVIANEVTDATNWVAGGRALTMTFNGAVTANTVWLDSTDTAGGGNVTLANVYGCLVYDDSTTPKQGFCYNYFGGAQGVTAGTFTIVWHANGIWRLTL
jgi:hypothetical protein